jgi:hypothetical protein
LFRIFIDYIIGYVSKNNPHAPEIGTTTIPGLLFADDFTFSSFTINGLQKTTNKVTEYCRECNSKCNLNISKILEFRKEGKLKKDERWTVNDQKTEVADEINCLGVTFESIAGWKKQQLKKIAKGNQILVTIDKCLARTPDIRMKILENVYELLS